MIQQMHKNSLKAFGELKSTDRRALIFKVFESLGYPLTDRDVKDVLGYTDMNYVRPRISELIHEGKIIECGTEVDRETKKHVRLCRVKTTDDVKQMSFL